MGFRLGLSAFVLQILMLDVGPFFVLASMRNARNYHRHSLVLHLIYALLS